MKRVYCTFTKIKCYHVKTPKALKSTDKNVKSRKERFSLSPDFSTLSWTMSQKATCSPENLHVQQGQREQAHPQHNNEGGNDSSRAEHMVWPSKNGAWKHTLADVPSTSPWEEKRGSIYQSFDVGLEMEGSSKGTSEKQRERVRDRKWGGGTHARLLQGIEPRRLLIRTPTNEVHEHLINTNDLNSTTYSHFIIKTQTMCSLWFHKNRLT